MWKRFRPTLKLRQALVLNTTVIGLLIALFLTPTLWYDPDRLYPLVPIIEQLPILPTLLHGILFASASIALGVAVALPHLRRRATVVALVSLSVLALFDITRLQPWLFQYGLVLFIFYLGWKRHHSPNMVLDHLRLVIAAVYFWSGVQKLNGRFITEIFPWFTETLWSPFGEPGAFVTFIVALLVPFFEAAIGIGLLTRRYRHIALIGAGIMLVTVLVALGSLGQNWNMVVWPWNIALFLTAVALFWRTQDSARELWQHCRTSVFALVLIAMTWLYPLGNWFGISDYYLSWSLYSGRVPEAELLADPALLAQFYPQPEAGSTSLRLQRWSTAELGVVPYPEVRIFRRWFENLCADYPSQNLTLTIHTYTNADEPALLHCEQ